MTAKDDRQLVQDISELKGIVTEGFRAVHQRQDTANGKLSKHEDSIIGISENVARIDGELDGAEKEKNKKIMTTQNIIAAAAVLIAVVTWLYK